MPKNRMLQWDEDNARNIIEDNLNAHPAFTQAIVRAFPNGPPNEEVGFAVLRAEIERTLSDIQGGVEADTGIQRIDTDSQYEIKSAYGIIYSVARQGRNKWRLVVTSPPSPNGKNISITQVVPGDKASALIALGLYLSAAAAIRLNLVGRMNELSDKDWADIPVGMLKMVEVFRCTDPLIWDEIYGSFNGNVRQQLNVLAEAVEKRDAKRLIQQVLDEADLTPQEVVLTSVMHLHEMWTMHMDKVFSEELALVAKNNGGHIWWLISGGRKPMNKVINTLQSNRHFLVLANDETCYLRIQNSESPFVQGLASEYNCRAKLCDEPVYGETDCGKLHMNVGYHQRKCNACSRAKANVEAAQAAADAKEARETAEKAELEAKMAQQEAASQNKAAVANEPAYPSTKSPDGRLSSGVGSIHPRNPVVPPRVNKRAEEKEWASKNGEVITVQGARVGIDPMDFTALAEDYRRISDELLERANYYSTLAERYEALLQPSDKVMEAERQLAEAKASEETDRNAKLEALMSLITEGPPEPEGSSEPEA